MIETGVAEARLPRLQERELIWTGLAAATAIAFLLRLAYSAICQATVGWAQGNWRYQGSPDWAGASRLLPAQAAGDPVGVVPGIQIGVGELYTHRSRLPRTGAEPGLGPAARAAVGRRVPRGRRGRPPRLPGDPPPRR